MELKQHSLAQDALLDCIIIGAGPGGLQAAIYLGRYNRKVLIIDRGGGRTAHAKAIENFLTQKSIPGRKMIELGMEQALSFNVQVVKRLVTSVAKKEFFEVTSTDALFRARFVIVSTGVSDILPPIGDFSRFLGTSFFTCIDCDGYKTLNKKLVVMGNSIETVRLAFAIKELYTRDVTLVLSGYAPPEGYLEELQEQAIQLVSGDPARIVGIDRMEGIELRGGKQLACEAIMSNYGSTMNDAFLKDLSLKRDAHARSFIVNNKYESSLSGLYIVGPLNTGHDQAVIAAGQGAVAAIDINKRLFDF